MGWCVWAVVLTALVLGANADPEFKIACPDKYYEGVFRNSKGAVRVLDSTDVGSLFNIPKETGKLSVAIWMKLSMARVGEITLIDIVGRPTVNGTVVNGDRLHLYWDADQGQMYLAMNVGDGSFLVKGLGVIPLFSDRYHSILIAVDSMKATVAVSIDSVEVINYVFPPIYEEGVNFLPMASLGYGTTTAKVTSKPLANITLGDLTVFNNRYIEKEAAEYLSQFRVPMKNNKGKCVVDTGIDDPTSPFALGNVHTFFFFKTKKISGFSFKRAVVTNEAKTIVESPFQIKARTVTGDIQLSSTSWILADMEASSCGNVQTATISYTVSSSAMTNITMELKYAAQPPTGTVFSLTNMENGEVLGNFATPMKNNTLWFYYNGRTLRFKLQPNGNFDAFCIKKIRGYEVGNAIADPHVIYYEQDTSISVYTGVRLQDKGALVPLGEPCTSNISYKPFEYVRTTAWSGYLVFNVKEVPPGVYNLCIQSGNASEQTRPAAQCDGGSVTNTFLCSVLVAEVPSNAIPLPPGWVRNLLHLGESYYDSLPITELNGDPFFSMGGESVQEPEFGDTIHMNGTRYLWFPLGEEDGRFARMELPVTGSWVQYFALAVYSPSTQGATITVRYNTTTRVYFDGEIVFEKVTRLRKIDHSSSFTIAEGWHQVIIKVFFSGVNASGPEMSIRFDNAKSLSWNYVKPSGNSTGCTTEYQNVSCFGNPIPTVSHKECMEAGCCYNETNEVKCFLPGESKGYNANGRCGPNVSVLSPTLEFAECNPNSCCASSYCGRSYEDCTCPTCVDYNFIEKPRNKYILWGTGATCTGARNERIGGFTKEVCRLRCDRDDECVAFSLGTPDAKGVANCHLLYGTCTETVEDPTAKETYLRLRNGCKMTEPETGGCSSDSAELTKYGEDITSESCLRSCSMTSQCAAAVYNTQTKTCMFSSTECTKGSDENSTISRFECSDSDKKPPTPSSAVPQVLNSTLLGCYKDPKKEYFASSQYPEYGQNLYTKNYILMSKANKTLCADYCLQAGALFFAMTNGNVCTCGVYNNERLRERNQSKCNMSCLDDNSSKCGGKISASVYKISPYASNCEHGYSYFQGKCYKIVREKKIWGESRNYCADEDAVLTSVPNALVSQYLLSLAEGEPIWIGARRMSFFNGHLFYLTDGSPFVFSDWLPREPNGHISDQREDCVLAAPSHPTPYEGSWMDKSCSTPQSFACMKDPSKGSVNLELYLGGVVSQGRLSCIPKEEFDRITKPHLVGHYLLHENKLSGKTFHDISAKANDIEIKGTMEPSWINGEKDQKTLSFDGSFYIQAKNVYSFSSRVFTVALWARPGAENMSDRVLVSKSYSKETDALTPPYEWALAFKEGYICFIVSAYSACATYEIPRDKWTHVVGSYDSSGIVLFLNGEYVAHFSMPSPPVFSNAQTLMVIGGVYRDPASHVSDLIGSVDDVRIYEAAFGHPFALYLTNCEKLDSYDNLISTYLGSASSLRFAGSAIRENEKLLLSPVPCTFGTEVTVNSISFIWFNDILCFFYIPPFPDAGENSKILNLCAARPSDYKFIVKDLHFRVAVVTITSLMGVSSSEGLIILPENTKYPLKMELSGVNIAKDDVLVLSLSRNCVFQDVLNVTNVNEDGTSGEVELKEKPTNSLLYVCWAKNGSLNADLTPYTIESDSLQVAVTDGSTQIDSLIIHGGITLNDGKFFNPCATYNYLEDNFFMILTMGDFKDFFIPRKNTTLCTLLTSTETDAFTYSPFSPDDPRFMGHVHFVPPYHDFVLALGSSPVAYPLAAPRQRLSSWGTNNFTGVPGGCCQTTAEDTLSWGRAYSIEVSRVDKNKVWLVWEHPRVISAEAQVYFYVALKNFRGEIQSGIQKFRVTIGSESPIEVMSDADGVLEFVREAPEFKQGEPIKVTLDFHGDLNPENGKSISKTFDVRAPIPNPALALDATKPIPAMLRFGPPEEGIELPDGVHPFGYDWLVESESLIRPHDSMPTKAKTSTSSSYTSTWRRVSADASGSIMVNTKNRTLHYFAFAVYSPDTEKMMVEVDIKAEMEMYTNGKVVFSTRRNGWGNDAQLSVGWNQVLIKVYAREASVRMKVRLMASGSGWLYGMPTAIPPKALLLEEGRPISAALRTYGRTDFIYHVLDWDAGVNMQLLRPRKHDSFFTYRWEPAHVSHGQWLVDGTLAIPGVYAMRYLAFALYAIGDVRVVWNIYCHGPVWIWIDGVFEFQCDESNLPRQASWNHLLLMGWHQVLVKIGAAPNSKWFFTMTLTGTKNMVAIAHEMGSMLPEGVQHLESHQVIKEMLLLQPWNMYKGKLSEIPRNANEGPSSTDFDINRPIATWESVPVMIYGTKSVDFTWLSQTRSDGTFGSIIDTIAGDYKQYYSFSLYSTNVSGKFLVSYHGAFNMFIDGVLVSSESGVLMTVIPFNFTMGWHQVVFKLTAGSDFHWFEDNGTTTWSEANANCTQANYSRLCGFDAYCPYRQKRESLPEFNSSMFAPLLSENNNGEEDYVQIYPKGGDGVQLCQKWSEAHGGKGPAWSGNSSANPLRQGYACCGYLDTPKITVQFVYTDGEVGIRLGKELRTLLPPFGMVDDTDSTKQTVTLRHPDKDVTIIYKISAQSSEEKKYTAPFMVNQTWTIVFWGKKGSENSPYQYLEVVTPTPVVFYRTICPEYKPCAVEVDGAVPGRHMALVSNESDLKPYEHYDTASKIDRNSKTTGIIDVHFYHYAFIPVGDLERGTYIAFQYPNNAVGNRVQDTLQIEPLEISPSNVTGNQNTIFKVNGLDYMDKVLFLDQWPTSSHECIIQNCYMALSDKNRTTGYVTLNHSVMIDLRGFAGALKCLCVSVTGSSAPDPAHLDTVDITYVSAVPVNISVVAPPTPTKDTIEFISPSDPVDGGDLVFGGYFSSTSNKDYNVLFIPIRGDNTMRPPTCRVKSVNHTTLVCTVSISVGTIGVWFSETYKRGENVTYDGAVNSLTCVPPAVEIYSAFGDCASKSSLCVNGAEITFVGINFDHYHDWRNVVEFVPIATDGNRVESNRSPLNGALRNDTSLKCVTVTVTSTSLTCKLENTEFATENAIYAVDILLHLSKYYSRRSPVNGTLLLKGGDEPGWSGVIQPDIPTTQTPEDSRLHTAVVAISVTLSIIIVLFAAAAIFMKYRYKFVRKGEGEEEMSYMEEQLLRAEQESTASLKRTTLNTAIPLLKPSVHQQNSLDEL